MATINVLDSVGSTVAIEKPLVPGRAAAASSRPVVLSTEDAAFLDGIEAAIASTNTKLDTLNGSVSPSTAPGTDPSTMSGVQGSAGMSPLSVYHDTNKITNDGVLLTPKYAKIAASSSGNNTLVAAVASKKIRVLAYNIMAAAAVNAKFQDGAGGTDLTGLKYFDAAGAGISVGYNPVGWFETTANTLLNLNLSGAQAVGGELVYIEV
jgi:hypothetical protein